MGAASTPGKFPKTECLKDTVARVVPYFESDILPKVKSGKRLVIAAHGSWERGPMPTQALHQVLRAGDLLGFKAHFKNVGMATDVMPLLIFPGGYGGMVHTDGGRVSLSCCIRRDQLERCRRQSPNLTAGAAVLAHVQSSCNAVAQALSTATLEGAWLSAGPLRTEVARLR